MKRGWTATAVGASLALAGFVSLLGTTASAAARSRLPVTAELVGSLTIAWHGDQARGCLAQGLCGVSGSLQMLPSGASSSSPGPPPIELVDSSAVARVTELSAGGATETTCVDPVPVDFQLIVRHTSAGALRAVVGPAFPQEQPSAGRCAGPTAADLSALTLPARKLGRHSYDLSGRTTFGAGPFTVTAISTVRALFRRGSGGTGTSAVSIGTGSLSSVAVGPSPQPFHVHTVLQAHAEVDYRIEGLSGTLSTAFAGLPVPLCDPLGACGTTGNLTETFGARGVVSFFGLGTVKRRVESRAALALLRAGRFQLFDSFNAVLDETATGTLARPDGTTCADRRTEALLPGQSTGSSRRTVELQLSGPQTYQSGADPTRTRCPGPSSTDILGTSPLAAATISTAALGARRLTITFKTGGSFTGSGYGGGRSGSVILTLVLKHASGGTSRVPVPSIPRFP